ncbi:hypothetical protein [Ureibacillus acetophenoni]|uniref:Lipoprotein n=1 Tax=Ureibacillus acetophenoni TaxID=614649 RepID=A0A285UIH0_9BACL|nr:hypothetical protein [Ureibacillus acetophenoni]SOC41573.1 hypothetical protein SAMN05877842_110174 [Ureibacillus acetophenoni]
MKSNLMLIILSLLFLLVGCNEISKETAHYPEDALKNIEVGNKEREIIIYGSHKVNEDLVLFVFRGVMNDKDVWIADVHKDDGQWVAKEIVQMNGPFKGKGNIQTVVTNDEFGYEVGYIESNNSETDDLNIIEIEGIEDWKIWIKKKL